ncbi:MAG: type VI secretion system protein TssA [Gemmatimonadales bacterium]
MPLRGDLLNPIPGADPAGADLRYDPVYDKIKEARHQDDDSPQGDWQRQRKIADFAMVAKLAGDALAGRSKDLQLAAWLTEAQLHREGFAGLLSGLNLIRSLLVEFWDGLHPPIEEGDPELRAAPLAWIGYSLAPLVRSVPLNRTGHDFFKYKESRLVGFEADAANEQKTAQARQQAIADGKLSGEEFDQGFESTPKSWYKSAAADLAGSLAALEGLDAICKERFGDASPSFSKVQEALAEVQRAVGQLLGRKLALDPDPPEPEPVAPAGGNSADPVAAPSPTERPMNVSEAVDREDATSRVVAAARFLRRTEPRNPASYLLLRGFRWGEVRAQGGSPDPRLLDAPTTQVRTHLKGLLLEAKWSQLLESAEGVMATPAGRGWLDLQRYVLTACRGLGGEYDTVTRAIRSELRALLADVPQLTTMTLMDDMPTANHETLQWLRDGHFTNGAEPAPDAEESDASSPPGTDGLAAGDPAFHSAQVEARAGRPQRGIEMLMGALAREKTARARFLRRTQVSRMMVEAGLEPIAVPILEELLELVERHNLADWESGELVAEPMALLHRCMDKVPAEVVKGPHTQASLYPRICSLDPLQAMSLSQT